MLEIIAHVPGAGAARTGGFVSDDDILALEFNALDATAVVEAAAPGAPPGRRGAIYTQSQTAECAEI
jgi:hypothetical protein